MKYLNTYNAYYIEEYIVSKQLKANGTAEHYGEVMVSGLYLGSSKCDAH